MNKTELIEAIQQVIVPNGQKAITAESLANLLTEIVEAMGTGSGNGQVVFYLGKLRNEGTPTLDLTPEQMAHNAEMFNIVKESPIAISASIDMTEFMVQTSEDEVDATDVRVNVQPIYTEYFSESVASLGGLSSEGIMMVNEVTGSALVYPDGHTSLSAE